jgi:hypothetical protein
MSTDYHSSSNLLTLARTIAITMKGSWKFPLHSLSRDQRSMIKSAVCQSIHLHFPSASHTYKGREATSELMALFSTRSKCISAPEVESSAHDKLR